MSNKSRFRRNQPSPRRFPWPWLAVAIVVLLLIGGSLVVWNSFSRRPEVPPQVTGAPKLMVDPTSVDEGYVQFDVPVRTTYRLSNVGDQPLTIMAAPVELVEGC
jgi:hypothetical protein